MRVWFSVWFMNLVRLASVPLTWHAFMGLLCISNSKPFSLLNPAAHCHRGLSYGRTVLRRPWVAECACARACLGVPRCRRGGGRVENWSKLTGLRNFPKMPRHRVLAALNKQSGSRGDPSQRGLRPCWIRRSHVHARVVFLGSSLSSENSGVGLF